MMTADEFTKLCDKYHTPKAKLWEGAHDYAPHYAELIESRCTFEPIRKVLEIGLGTDGLFHKEYRAGHSLRLWAEAFPAAEIYGADIAAEALIEEPRIHTMQCDQSNLGDLLKLAKFVGRGIDLIVDDGSHRWQDQLLTLITLGPMLSPTGLYVIEDVVSPELYTNLIDAGVRCAMIECSGLPGIIDDRLVVVRGGWVQ
jgi:hypothetical protein